ncbi:hypothetical protein K456DRAFT_277954 [Colletotrichum gloeosporioides 23]|nr:hypothetical protein K456DRAFT_277954 [Colletotrichum gloeosporioides 23]
MRGTRKQKRSLRSPTLKTIETTLSASVFSSSRICLAPHICKSLSNHHPVVSDGQSIIPNSQGMEHSTDPGTKHGQNRVSKIETQPPPPCRKTTQATLTPHPVLLQLRSACIFRCGCAQSHTACVELFSKPSQSGKARHADVDTQRRPPTPSPRSTTSYSQNSVRLSPLGRTHTPIHTLPHAFPLHMTAREETCSHARGPQRQTHLDSKGENSNHSNSLNGLGKAPLGPTSRQARRSDRGPFGSESEAAADS